MTRPSILARASKRAEPDHVFDCALEILSDRLTMRDERCVRVNGSNAEETQQEELAVPLWTIRVLINRCTPTPSPEAP